MEGRFGACDPLTRVNDCNKDESALAVDLPPGFRFHPTDEEIIMHYLVKKIADKIFSARAIGEADLNKCEPWDLPKMAKMGEKEWFFFFRRDRKYPTGMRMNRATGLGYWKATGKDKEIHKGKSTLIGMKKTLVFYTGRAPKGQKSNWVMHEYRLEGNALSSTKATNYEEWVVCKVFHKNTAEVRNVELARIESLVDHLLDSPSTLPALTDSIATNGCHNNGSKGNLASSSGLATGDQNTFFTPSNYNDPHTTMNKPFSTPYNLGQQNPLSFPNPAFQQEAPAPLLTPTLGYHQQQGRRNSMLTTYHCNAAPWTGIDNQASSGQMGQNMERFSSNNSVISHSQETGLSTENVVNEITSVPSVEGNYQPFDQDLLEGGLSFMGNSISDLLWS